jgi:hypothetical protein
VSNQIQEQQFDYIVIKDGLAITDSSTVISNSDSIYLFYQPVKLSSSDSLYQTLINPYIVKTKQTDEYGFIPKGKAQYIPNWTVAIILVLFILLASIRNASEIYLPQIFQSIFNRKVALRLFREKVSTLFNISFRLDTFFYLVTGLFIFQVINHFSEFSSKEAIIYCGIIIVAFPLYKAVKFTIYRICGSIFDTASETREYIFHAKTGDRVIGLLLFPVVLFLFIIKGNYIDYLLYFGIVFVSILTIINILRGMIIIAQKVFSVYYMILYLCTLEILPLLVVGKILLMM